MLKSLSVFLIVVLIFLLSQCNEDEDDVFVATHEWQIVKRGQKIPKGLHVRINLETGLTEAKLLEPEDKTKALTPMPHEPDPDDKIIIDHDQNIQEETIKQVKNKFRSYDEIKKSLGELNLTPKMDAEILLELMQRHKEASTEDEDEELLLILEDLDYMVHQYDNALEFTKQNGFQDIIYKNINGSAAPKIKKETLKLMGSLMQNNVQPKINALETGSINILLRLINSDLDKDVRYRALGSLSALLRAFPAAQQQFLDSGGLTVLSNFFKTDEIKIQIKLVTLISDLIQEHQSARGDDKLTNYYNKFDLAKRVLEHDWCQNLNKLLLGLIITDKDDHDSVEKCLVAMHTLRIDCGGLLEKELLISLQKRYQTLSDSDTTGDTFFLSLKHFCDDILYYVDKKYIKTEL